MRQPVIASLLLLFLACACNGGGGGGDESWEDVHPPASIDIKSCYAIVNDSTNGTLDRCGACCTTAGYSSAGFINNDHCTCGNSFESVACPTPTTTGDECSACCHDIGYLGASGVTACTCFGKTDPQICAVVLSRKNPSDQCSLCCLNNGFLSSAYTGIGARECKCISP